MFRTLYSKITLVLLILFCVVGFVFMLLSIYVANLYQQEVTQRLNQDLAMYIANERVLIEEGAVNRENLNQLFHQAMIINPSLELYLLSPEGTILSHAEDLDGIKNTEVSLLPIKKLIHDQTSLPVMGDDPKQPDVEKVFTVFPIQRDGLLQGYIYGILGSEQFEHIATMIQNSYILKLSVATILVALLFAFTSGVLIIFFLTRKFRRLSQEMVDFKNSDFEKPLQLSFKVKDSGDEIDRMILTFQQMAERIHTQMHSLKETDTLRRELVANVSHDLRTPLSSMKGYLDTLLLKDATLTEEKRREYLLVAQRHSDRLSRLVVELFELAKLDANELKPHKEPFSLAELLHDVVQKFELRADEMRIQIKIKEHEDAIFVEADIGMIERVLDNLIDNALKHTTEGGSVELSLISEHEGQGRVVVNIADTGAGIADKDIPHIFKRFYRHPPEGDKAYHGAGLGLAIAYRIVELHGSRLSVYSKLNKGTVFGFSLPNY